MRFTALKKVFPTCHLEKMKGTPREAVAYCLKMDTRVVGEGAVEVCGGTFSRLRPPSHVDYAGLYPWQRSVVDYVRGPVDDRTIAWIWEPNGAVGKTALVRHLVCTRDDVLVLGGKSSDMAFAIQSYLSTKGYGPKCIVLNLVRSREAYVSYEGIEMAKDGIGFSPKYESGMFCIDPPHIIVFANWQPDLAQMSADRWVIREVTNKETVLDLRRLPAPTGQQAPSVPILTTADAWRMEVDDVPPTPVRERVAYDYII